MNEIHKWFCSQTHEDQTLILLWVVILAAYLIWGLVLLIRRMAGKHPDTIGFAIISCSIGAAWVLLGTIKLCEYAAEQLCK